MRSKGIISSKGQILMIIGIVIALGLYLVYTTAEFSSAMDVDGVRAETKGVHELRSLERGFRETYERTVKGGTDDDELNTELGNFVVFTRERSGPREIGYIFSTTTDYNSSHMVTSIQNFLDRDLETVEVNGTECSASGLSNSESCSVYLEEYGGEYTVEISYTDVDGTNYTKTYSGLTGFQGSYSSVFYRTELKIDGVELVSEKEAWSRTFS